jgi:hypothetical protein
MKQPTRLNYNSSAASLLAVAGLMATGVAPIWATPSISADFSTYVLGALNSQNGWAQVGTTNTMNPIQVIAATTTSPVTPQSIKLKGVASASVSYKDLPTAFNPATAVAGTTFYYVIDDFKVIQAYVSSTGAGSGVCALQANIGGTGTSLCRLFVRRYAGSSTNTTTFDLGINPGSTGSAVSYGTTAFANNTLYKIVVGYTANTGTGTDTIKVYVNPAGLNPSSWTPEVTQTLAADAVAMKSFVWQPGSPATGTNELTASRLMVGDTLSELLLPPAAPVSAAATNINPSGFTAN